jgi:tetratricopeptide (TPR) repeat protein
MLVAIAAYWPALGGGALWDDIGHLTRPDLRPVSGLWRIWFDVGATQQYYPVVHTAFWVFHRIWGDALVPYHVANVLLHASSACLIVLLLCRLSVPGAWLAGVLFLVHPVHVESVAWITELKNTLSTTFCLGAMLAYLTFDDRRSRRAYWTSLGLFLLAVLSKTVTAVLPATLLVVLWWRRGRLTWRTDVVPLLPFFLVGLAAGLTTIWVEHAIIGASGDDFQLSIVERGLVAGRAVLFYASKLVWPHPLIFVYPRWDVDAAVWWQYLYPAAVATILIMAWTLRARTRSPLAVALLFVVTLAPALGFVNVYPFRYSFVADHFQYLASIPVLAAIAASLVMALSPRLARAEAALVVALGLGLAVMTGQASRAYQSSERLFTETLAENPACWMCYDNLAVIRAAAGDMAGARRYSEMSIAVAPDNATGHYNLGVAYAEEGRLEDAMREHREAIRLRPQMVGPHQSLGILLRQAGRPIDALVELRRTVELAPQSPAGHRELGFGLMDLNRLDEAAREFEEALRLNPALADAHDGLATTLRLRGRLQDAANHYREAARLEPSSPQYVSNLGSILMELGKAPEALAAFQTAARLAPREPLVQFNLGAALAGLGRTTEAIRAFEEAIRLQPDYPEARAALQQLLGAR